MASIIQFTVHYPAFASFPENFYLVLFWFTSHLILIQLICFCF